MNELMTRLNELAEVLKPYRCKDTSLLIYQALKGQRKVLFEGAQGTLLDLLHGTYPFVTSSSTLAGSACIGAGVGPTSIDKVIGITKAYTTRVGSGPFPTEQINEVGERLRSVGHEFGSTTGRERRCGWLDLVALNYAIRINGITNLALMKIDVLSGFDEIKICTKYRVNGELTENFPTNTDEVQSSEPVYEVFPGWQEDITKITRFEDLPEATKSYINVIKEKTGLPIDMVSVGPDREQTFWIQSLFNH